MCRYLSLFAVLSLTFSACNKAKRADDVLYFSQDDPKMNKAIEKARASVNSFITALKSPKPGQSSFAIKMKFKDGENVEHMWISEVTFDGTKFNGKINNDPIKVKSIKLGQQTSVAPNQISDWMYIDNRKLVGGETMRVMRDGLSAAERAEFDKSVPFTID